MRRNETSRPATRRRCGPSLEGLESRNYLSVASWMGPLAPGARAPSRPTGLAREFRALPRAGARPSLPADHLARPNLRPFVPDDLPPPIDAAHQAGLDRNPTPTLVSRGAYTDKISGSYRISHPDYLGMAAEVLMEGYQPTTWLEHRGKSVNILLMVPESPGAQITGQAILDAPGSTGRLVLNLEEVPESNNPLLPTHLTWNVDSSASTGLFSGANGQGVLRITYPGVNPSAYNLVVEDVGPSMIRIPPGFPRGGRATFFFSGLVNLSPLPFLLREEGGAGD